MVLYTVNTFFYSIGEGVANQFLVSHPGLVLRVLSTVWDPPSLPHIGSTRPESDRTATVSSEGLVVCFHLHQLLVDQ